MIGNINPPTMITGRAAREVAVEMVDVECQDRAIRADPQEIKTLRVLKRKNIAVGQRRMRW